MPEYEHILVDHEDGVAIVTLNRPEVLNAMNNKLSAELHDAIVQADANDDVGCIVITGSGGKAFTAGGDIHEQRENDVKFSQEELDAKRDVYMSGAYEISASKKPTIGMMNGLAYGGGAVLASSLDMQIGLLRKNEVPISGRLRTHKQHLDFAQSGRLADGKRVAVFCPYRGIGRSISHRAPQSSCPESELRDKTMTLAKLIAGNHTGAVTGIKELMLRDLGTDLRTQWTHEVDHGKNIMRGAKAEDAFPDFIARKGREIS